MRLLSPGKGSCLYFGLVCLRSLLLAGSFRGKNCLQNETLTLQASTWQNGTRWTDAVSLVNAIGQADPTYSFSQMNMRLTEMSGLPFLLLGCAITIVIFSCVGSLLCLHRSWSIGKQEDKQPSSQATADTAQTAQRVPSAMGSRPASPKLDGQESASPERASPHMQASPRTQGSWKLPRGLSNSPRRPPAAQQGLTQHAVHSWGSNPSTWTPSKMGPPPRSAG